MTSRSTDPSPSVVSIMASAAPDDGRPPGGTARTPGTKTPRKVQWAFDEHTKSPDPSLSTHALDELGLDPDAFEALKGALERHRSLSPTRRSSSYPPALPNFNTSHINSANTTTTESTPSTPGSTDYSPTRSIPGVFIGESERSGLPGTANLEGFAHREAGKVVRARTRTKKGWWESMRKLGKENTKKQKRKALEQDEKSGDTSTDVERDARPEVETSRTRGRGGVLSALLTLYDRDQHSQVTSEAATPVRSSFSDSENEHPDPPERPWIRRRSPVEQQHIQQPPAAHNADNIHHNPQHGLSSGIAPPLQPPQDSDKHTLGRSHTSGSMPNLFHTMSLPFTGTRTPETRNAGGVFGPLIASTGNITGAAAPAPSTVAPNIKRHGYHLSRYSLDTNLPPKRSPKPDSAPRPHSTHFDTSSVQSSGYSTPETHPSPSPHEQTPLTPSSGKEKHHNIWSGVLSHLPHASSSRSGMTTPTTDEGEWAPAWGGGNEKMHLDHDRRREKRRKRRKAEIYITRHVAEIIQRQEFILKLARAFMMFGGPSHRLQAQIQSTAKVLDIELSCMYLPDVMLLSFDDSGTGTSNIKFIRQSSALDLGKLHDAYGLYWRVIHDELSVSEASSELDTLMRKKPMYNWIQLVLIGGMCSASICSVSFKGSFIDSLISFPLGGLLVGIQLLSARNELYSNVFEITIATLLSFVAAALASTHRFCYSAVASSSVVLILPGFIVLCGSLELSSRSIVSGAVRLCYALMYSLFLGFGLAIGAEMYEKMSGKTIVGPEDYSCSESHNPQGSWWQRTPSLYFAFLTVPMYSLFLSLRNQAPWNRKELLILIIISSIGWVTNHFTSLKFVNQSDISAAVGAFAVGMVSNLYGRFFSGNAFIVMITGILFQLPSGLGNGGLLTFASQQISGSSSSYLSGFQTALQLISVSVGLTVGLGISLVLVHPIQSRRRAGGVFSL